MSTLLLEQDDPRVPIQEADIISTTNTNADLIPKYFRKLLSVSESYYLSV